MRPFTTFAVAMCALAIGCGAPSSAFAAKQKPAAKAPAPTTPAPAPAARRDSTVLTAVAPSGVARTPGPLVTPGSPIADRTTIAPFPIPGDTGRAARELAKMMNFPRQGMTANKPMPPGAIPQMGGSVPLNLSEPQPVYPDAARDAGIQGTVIVMAYVLADGTVGETRVIHSIPALDDAAVEAVKRMRFWPTYFHDQPAADWVGVPVRFKLH